MSSFVFALPAVGGVLAAAQAPVVGRWESGCVNVASGESETIASPLVISSDGTFAKTGAGTLNLPLSALETITNRVSYQVLGGTLALTTDDVPVPALAVPECVTAKAAAWFSAADGTYIETDGSGNVTKWYDVREENVASPGFVPMRRYMSHACAQGMTDGNQAKTSFLGRSAVYFGGYDARNLGGYMQLTAPDGIADNLPYVWNVFYVHGVHDALGTVIGHTSQPSDFKVSSSTARIPSNGRKGVVYNAATAVPGMFSARYYRNGVYCDPFQEWMYQDTYECVDVDFARNATGFNCFYNDLNLSGRFGGDYISEAIVFTNRLSETERVQVERYLMRKWNLSPQGTPRSTFGIADGAAIAVPAVSASVTSAIATNALPVEFKGNGVVRLDGSDSLVLDPSAYLDFAGTFELGAGTLFSRFGVFPAVDAHCGERFVTTLSRYAMKDVCNGISLRVEQTSSEEVEKVGPETVSFSSIADGVKKVRVQEGVLSLRGMPKTETYIASDAVSAVFENPNMEKVQYDDPNGNRGRVEITSGSTRDGWSVDASGGYKAGYLVGPLLRPDYEWCYDVPEGRQALYVFSSSGSEGQATIYTSAFFPAAGSYIVSWRASNSLQGQLTSLKYSIVFGSDYANAQAVHHSFNGVVGAPREYMRLEVPGPGTYCFGFRIDENYGRYYAMVFDDLRADLESERSAVEVVEIPNGDFEQITTNGAPAGLLALVRRDTSQNVDPKNVPVGWTLYQGDGWTEAVGGATVGVVAPGIPWHHPQVSLPSNRNWRTFSRPFDRSFGLAQLLIAGSPAYGVNASASTTFTVAKAGTYRLRGKVGICNCAYLDVDYFGRNGEVPTVRACVTVAGDAVDLGSVSSTVINPQDMLWPRSFSIAANASVTLRIDQTTQNAACLVDDLVLVREDDAPVMDGGEELISNGSFEMYATEKSDGERTGEAVWIATEGTGSATQKISYWANGTAGGQYTIAPFDGKVVCCVRGDSSICQTLPPISAGRYRFRVAANTRWTSGYGENGIRVTLNDPNDGSVKYTVCDISEVTNWHAQVTFHDVVVDDPGTYVLMVKGTHADLLTGDRACAVDGLSLKRVYESRPPAVPKDMKIVVSSGAKLDLDYDGMVRVLGVSFGGRSAHGIVDAESHSGFVTGRGKINVVPNGTVIVFR